MKDIVAVIFAGKVYTDITIIKELSKNNQFSKLISKQEANFMKYCDLGLNWNNLAESPILFSINDEGKIIDGLFKSTNKKEN